MESDDASIGVLKAAVLVDAAMSYRKTDHLSCVMDVDDDPSLSVYLERFLLSTSNFWTALMTLLVVLHLSLALLEFQDPVAAPVAVTGVLELLILSVHWYDFYLATFPGFFRRQSPHDVMMAYLAFLREDSAWTLIALVLLTVSTVSTTASLFVGGAAQLTSQLVRPVLAVRKVRPMRKIVNSIVKSLPDIAPILFLLLAVVVMFGYLGWLFFHGLRGDEFFTDIATSMSSMFVLVTTANYPAISIAPVNDHRGNALFFVLFLAVALFLGMNLVLAVVYDTYGARMREDVHRYRQRNTKAIERAYELIVRAQLRHGGLATNNNNNKAVWGSSSRFTNHWTALLGLLVRQRSLYWRLTDDRIVQVLFRALDANHDLDISLSEFRNVVKYAMADFDIVPVEKHRQQQQEHHEQPPRVALERPLLLSLSQAQTPMSPLATTTTAAAGRGGFDTYSLSDRIIDALVTVNAVVLGLKRAYGGDAWMDVIEWVFIVAFWVEMGWKARTYGLSYFSSAWPFLDLTVVALSTLFFLLREAADASPGDAFSYFRVVRLLRLVNRSRRYRVLRAILDQIRPVLLGIVGVVLMVMYCFAVTGIHAFNGLLCEDCVPAHLMYAKEGFFPLSFDGLPSAFLTLFSLLCVNDWHVIMDATVSVTGTAWARLYFIAFHIVAVILVLNVVIAFIIDMFLTVGSPSSQRRVREQQLRTQRDKELIVEAGRSFLAEEGMTIADVRLEAGLITFLVLHQEDGAVDDVCQLERLAEEEEEEEEETRMRSDTSLVAMDDDYDDDSK